MDRKKFQIADRSVVILTVDELTGAFVPRLHADTHAIAVLPDPHVGDRLLHSGGQHDFAAATGIKNAKITNAGRASLASKWRARSVGDTALRAGEHCAQKQD